MKSSLIKAFKLRPTPNYEKPNLDSFEVNWILELDPALDPSLHLGSSNHKLSILAPFFLGGETNWFYHENGAM
jgi:hypothetical protein